MVLFNISSTIILCQNVNIDDIKVSQCNELSYRYTTLQDTLNGFYKILHKSNVIQFGYIKMGYKNGITTKYISQTKKLIVIYDNGIILNEKFYSNNYLYEENIYNNGLHKYTIHYNMNNIDTGFIQKKVIKIEEYIDNYCKLSR